MFCTRCGAKNEPTARFCLNCAAILPTPSQPQASGTNPPQRPPSTDLPYPGYQGKQHPGFQHQQPLPTPGAPPPMQSYANQSGFDPYAPAPYAQQGASGRAIAALVCMILSFTFCGPISAIPGAILGKQEMSAIQMGQAPPAGMTLAKIGFYGSLISLILTCGGFLLWFAIVGAAGLANAFGN